MGKIFLAGHNGMVGSAILRKLSGLPNEVITASRGELDLTNQKEVKEFFYSHNFDQVYLAAAKVGGISANNEYPADFIYQNLMIQNNVIHHAHLFNVNKLLFLGSSCIYPKHAAQPITEYELLKGFLEPTNEPYAVAKIAGIKLCESYNRQFGRDFRSVMPTNLYGEGDNFHLENSHVIPGLIRRFHEAKLNGEGSVTAWGTGSPRREFLHVDDMAQASIFMMNLDRDTYVKNIETMNSHINIGTGVDVTIKGLTETIADVVGFHGNILWDASKPDGPARKLLDVAVIKNLGWSASIELREGLERTYSWFLLNQNSIRTLP
jgi:GDP-L-fucose synthase